MQLGLLFLFYVLSAIDPDAIVEAVAAKVN